MFKYNEQESKKKIKKIALYGSDTPVTLKQGQGHETWYDWVVPKQCYNHAKFETHRLNNVSETASVKVFVISGRQDSYRL